MTGFDWKRFSIAAGLQGLLIMPVLALVGDLRGIRLIATSAGAGAVLTGAQVVQSRAGLFPAASLNPNVIPASGGPEGMRQDVIDVDGQVIQTGPQEVVA